MLGVVSTLQQDINPEGEMNNILEIKIEGQIDSQ